MTTSTPPLIRKLVRNSSNPIRPAILLGDPPERHELPRGSVLVVQPGTALQLRNDGDEALALFIYGAPPERGEATFLPDVE